MYILNKLFSLLTFRKSSGRRNPAIDHAIQLVEQHGLVAHLYIPGVDHRDNKELCVALDLLASSGFIISDGKDNLVGKVITPRLTKDELAKARRANFRLVSSSPPATDQSPKSDD